MAAAVAVVAAFLVVVVVEHLVQVALTQALAVTPKFCLAPFILAFASEVFHFTPVISALPVMELPLLFHLLVYTTAVPVPVIVAVIRIGAAEEARKQEA
jgi:hypothetical protein